MNNLFIFCVAFTALLLVTSISADALLLLLVTFTATAAAVLLNGGRSDLAELLRSDLGLMR